MGELPPAECEVELWLVDDRDLDRAHALLEASNAGSDWRCVCGEMLGGQFSECWRCGAARAG